MKSLCNRFSGLTNLVFEHIDIIVVEQTKLDPFFLVAQFLIPGCYKPFRLDLFANSGGLLLYIKKSTHARELRGYEILFDI